MGTTLASFGSILSFGGLGARPGAFEEDWNMDGEWVCDMDRWYARARDCGGGCFVSDSDGCHFSTGSGTPLEFSEVNDRTVSLTMPFFDLDHGCRVTLELAALGDDVDVDSSFPVDGRIVADGAGDAISSTATIAASSYSVAFASSRGDDGCRIGPVLADLRNDGIVDLTFPYARGGVGTEESGGAEVASSSTLLRATMIASSFFVATPVTSFGGDEGGVDDDDDASNGLVLADLRNDGIVTLALPPDARGGDVVAIGAAATTTAGAGAADDSPPPLVRIRDDDRIVVVIIGCDDAYCSNVISARCHAT